MNPVSAIIQIANANGANHKVRLLQEYDSPQLRELLDRAYNPYRNYKIKHIDIPLASNKLYVPYAHKEFLQLLDMLEMSNVNQKIRDNVHKFLSGLPDPQRTIYTDILTKNLRIGATAKTINKAFGEIVIPVFDIMKADSYNPEIDLNRPMIVQEKMDGYRCIIIKSGTQVTAYSSNGNIIPLKTISTHLEKIQDNFVLDGELVNTTRTGTSSIVNALIKGNDKISDDTLVYYPFDIHPYDDYMSGNHTKTAHDRLVSLELVIKPVKHIQPIQSLYTNTVEEVITLYKQMRKQGKEGLIVKDPNGIYEAKRSKNWLKLKGINSCTLKVIDVFEGTNKYQGMLGGVVCTTADGLITTNVGSGFTDEDREVYWYNKPIGQYFEILFNEIQYDENQAPFMFLPRFKEHRIDKNEADDLQKILREIQ